MKFKNKYINKMIASGLIGSLLLSSIPFNSFANINKINNDISVTNTESESAEEISPQMLAVIASLAVASGITITTDDDLYDLGRIFYDYVSRNNDLTWELVKSSFVASVSVKNNLVNVGNNFLDIVKDYFDSTFSSTDSYVSGYYGIFPNLTSVSFNDLLNYINSMAYLNHPLDSSFTFGGIDFTLSRVESNINGEYYYYSYDSVYGDATGTLYLPGIYSSFRFCIYNDSGNPVLKPYGYSASKDSWQSIKSCYMPKSLAITYDLPYAGGYTWDNVESKKENESVTLPIPENLGQLVGQGSTYFWDNADNLINPCTQEIVLPEVENPSIAIGKSIKLQTDTNCSIYNAEELVTKAEESKDITDIENARNEVNKLPESQDKQELQDRLDAIIPNVALSINSATANLDVYIKSENSLVMTLDTSSITFDGFSSVEDITKDNAVTVTIKSSLPYELNSYLVQEITSLDDEPKILDKSILNIKANGEEDYNTFEDIGTTPILLLDNQTPGETNEHGIDFMLDADVPYENGNYKTVIKFEAQQK